MYNGSWNGLSSFTNNECSCLIFNVRQSQNATYTHIFAPTLIPAFLPQPRNFTHADCHTHRSKPYPHMPVDPNLPQAYMNATLWALRGCYACSRFVFRRLYLASWTRERF